MKDPRFQDDLLRPTLGGLTLPGQGAGPPPWQLRSQFYVAFLGGPLAATTVAWLNSGRLSVDSRRRGFIAAIGIVVSVAAAAAVGYLWIGADRDALRNLRIGGRAVSLLLSGCFYAMQKSADRLYQVNSRPAPVFASLWGPGTAIVVTSALLYAAMAFGAHRLWSGVP